MIRRPVHVVVLVGAGVAAGLAGRTPAAAQPAPAELQPAVQAEPVPDATGGAVPDATAEAAPDATLEQHRTPFDVLNERLLGSASRAVRFDWRQSTVGVAAFGSQLSELNNFSSAATGGIVRVSSGDFIIELGAAWVFTWGSESTRKLARTPYRQPGRPSRLEIDFNLGFPLAEGIVTAWPGFFPATELVLSLTGGFRYLYYPGQFHGAGFRDVAGAILAPTLSKREQANIDERRLPAMQVDSARYGLLVGLTTDIYFQNGFFVFPRVLLAVPVLAPLTQTHLRYWWELSLGLGITI